MKSLVCALALTLTGACADSGEPSFPIVGSTGPTGHTFSSTPDAPVGTPDGGPTVPGDGGVDLADGGIEIGADAGDFPQDAGTFLDAFEVQPDAPPFPGGDQIP